METKTEMIEDDYEHHHHRCLSNTVQHQHGNFLEADLNTIIQGSSSWIPHYR